MCKKSPALSRKKGALKAIQELIELAGKVFHKDKKLANRYVYIARRIAMKLNIRLPSELKRRFCRHCYSYLVPGVNLSVRIKDGKLVYYCHECRRYYRIPIKRPKL